MDRKRLKYFGVILLSGLLLAGCTHEAKDTSDLTSLSGDVIDVADIDTDDDADEVVSETPVSEDTDVDEAVVVEDEDTASDDEEEDEPVVEVEDAPLEGGDSHTGATKDDYVRIVGYEYGNEAGYLVFTWTFKSGNADKPIGSYEAGFDGSNNFVVVFSSISKDYVATEEKTTSLGVALPDLTWMPSGEGSKYTFEIGEETDYELTITDDKLELRLAL